MKVACKALTLAMAGAEKAHVASGAYSGPLYQPYLGLYTAISPSASPDSVMANITEASFTGYARLQNTTWSGPSYAAAGLAEILTQLLEWTPTDGAVPQNIAGVFWADALTAGNLLGVDPFPSPFPLPDQFSTLAWVGKLALQLAADYGAGILIN
jgi:hypothetical protein